MILEIRRKGYFMRIVIPVWGDRISPVLDTALRLLVIDFKDYKEFNRFMSDIGEEDLSWKCHRIKGLSPDILICGAVSHFFLDMLVGSGVNVIKHISGRIEEVLEEYFKGNIYNSRFLMPGCKKQGYVCGRKKKFIRQ